MPGFPQERAQILAAIFPLQKFFDHGGLVGSLIGCLRGLLGDCGGDAARDQISHHARFAKAAVIAAPTGVGAGETLVIQITGFLQARQHDVHVPRVRRAALQLLAQFGNGQRASR